MTVIAILHDLGLAFSDVMLSTDIPGQHCLLPSTGHTSHLPLPLSISPTRLVRKFFRVGYQRKSATFLVAGTVSHIEKLIVNIKRVRDTPDDLPNTYQTRLNRSQLDSIMHLACLITEEEGFPEFEILGVIDDRMFARQFDQNGILQMAPYFGGMRLAGGGASDLFQWIYQRGEQYALRPFAEEPADRKTLRTMNTVPSLLLEEDTRSTLRTIQKGVGGYYESFSLAKGEFTPQDRVLTIFAAVIGKGRHRKLELRRVFYHRYVSDWLLVLALYELPITLRPGVPRAVPLSHFGLSKIPPLFEPEPEPNWTVSQLASAINTAPDVRLTLYGTAEDHNAVTQRFFNRNDGRRLLTAKIKNNNIELLLREEPFSYYVSRLQFSDPDNPTIVIRH